MQTATFTEFRNHASHYFDLVEQGEDIAIIRHGRIIAEIKPVNIKEREPRWKSPGLALTVPGLSLSALILEEREKGR